MNKYQRKLNEALSIAIIRTDKIGDMVLTLPLFKALKSKCPDKVITMIASKYTKSLLESTLNNNEYICLENEIELKKHIKNSNYDVVFFPRPRFKEALIIFLSKAKLRIGSTYRWYSFLFNFKIKDHRKVSLYHEAEYNTRMLSLLLNEEIKTELIKPKIKSESIASLNEKLKENDFYINSDYIIIHPGSGGSARDWNSYNFRKLVLKLLELDKNIIITGIESESDICNKISEGTNAINLCGKLSFEELLALISESKLLIANSTGVIHLAASLEITTLGFYPNSPHLSSKRWGPYSPKSIIISPLDNSDDMNLISLESVVEKLRKDKLL